MIWLKHELDQYLKIQDYKNRIFCLLAKSSDYLSCLLKLKLSKLDNDVMTSIFLILIFLFTFLVLLFFIVFYSGQNKRSKKTIIIPSSKSFLEEQIFNPDISTDNWDIHKIRLEKFRRSQYKGLTFFVSSENRIYYLSEKGNKIYC